MDDALRTALLAALRPIVGDGALLPGAPLRRYTTLGLGGPADVLCNVPGAQALPAAMSAS